MAAIRYTLDGSEPTVSSPLYTGPFTVSQTTTVKFRSWDNGENVEPMKSQLVQIDTTAPISSISCNGSACSGRRTRDRSRSRSRRRTGIRGRRDPLHARRVGADSGEPVYSEPFTVSETTTVRYRAWDTAGNIEAARSQLIEVPRRRRRTRPRRRPRSHVTAAPARPAGTPAP